MNCPARGDRSLVPYVFRARTHCPVGRGSGGHGRHPSMAVLVVGRDLGGGRSGAGALWLFRL